MSKLVLSRSHETAQESAYAVSHPRMRAALPPASAATTLTQRTGTTRLSGGERKTAGGVAMPGRRSSDSGLSTATARRAHPSIYADQLVDCLKLTWTASTILLFRMPVVWRLSLCDCQEV